MDELWVGYCRTSLSNFQLKWIDQYQESVSINDFESKSYKGDQEEDPMKNKEEISLKPARLKKRYQQNHKTEIHAKLHIKNALRMRSNENEINHNA